MHKKLFELIKPLLKPLVIFSLAAVLVFSQVDGAWAASGGRIGGGSFRAPSSRTYSSPSRSVPGGGYGGYYPGGGFGLPFVYPLFFGGGGGVFTLLIFLSIAGFLVRSFRAAQADGTGEYETGSPTISVSKIQVGLLAQARDLQTDLNRIAANADTSSSAGLSQVLQETTLSLLRHPEYWVYGGTESQQARLESAEAQFNRLALAERSKFSSETLSNYNNLLRGEAAKQALPEAGGALAQADPGEYIVVTLLVASQGKLQLPAVNSTQDLRQAISQVGSVSPDRLMALEVLWSPQADGDTLSADDLLVNYPNLKLV